MRSGKSLEIPHIKMESKASPSMTLLSVHISDCRTFYFGPACLLENIYISKNKNNIFKNKYSPRIWIAC